MSREPFPPDEPPPEEILGVVPISRYALPNWKKVVSLIGVPVEEESYHTQSLPLVSFLFVALCLFIFIFGTHFEPLLYLDPLQPTRWSGLNFLSYALVHAGLLHLLGNLFFIWPFMDNVEEHLGHWKTLQLLVCSAAGSAFLHLVGDDSGLPLVGASGVCFAMATFYCLRYPRHRFLIAVPLLGILAFNYRLRLRARTLFLYFLVIELLGVLQQTSGLTSTSHLGHLGGAAMGALFYFSTRSSPDSPSTTI